MKHIDAVKWFHMIKWMEPRDALDSWLERSWSQLERDLTGGDGVEMRLRLGVSVSLHSVMWDRLTEDLS